MIFSKKKFLSNSEQWQLQKLYEILCIIIRDWETASSIKNKSDFLQIAEYIVESNLSASKLENSIKSIKVDSSIYEYLALTNYLEENYHVVRKDSNLVSQQLDYKKENLKRLPVTIIMDNLRSAYNVGSIFRSAECFGINNIILCGITPTPDNSKVIKTSMGTEKYINWEYCHSTVEAVLDLKQRDNMIVALETAPDAISLNGYEFIFPLVIIIGNEALGVSSEVMNIVKHYIKIPLSGWKNSLNVSTAASIALYEVSNYFSTYSHKM